MLLPFNTHMHHPLLYETLHYYSTGFVGLFDAILILPIVVIWHMTGLETFELPPTADIWTLLLINGFVGTVLSELLWLW